MLHCILLASTHQVRCRTPQRWVAAGEPEDVADPPLGEADHAQCSPRRHPMGTVEFVDPERAGRFELSAEHEIFRASVRAFAQREIAPYVAEWDRTHHFPVDLVHKMGDLGLFGLTAPEKYGGSGGDFTSLCVAIEELGRVDQSIGITLSAGVGLGINPILTFGDDARRSTGCPILSPGAPWRRSA